MTSLSTSYQFVLTYPLTYNSSYARGIAFSSFNWTINLYLSFTANILARGNSTSDTIEFQVLGALTVY
jgi:hypothetical protein